MISGPKGELFGKERPVLTEAILRRFNKQQEEINALKKEVKGLKRHVHAYNIFHTGHFGDYFTGTTTTPVKK